MSSAATRDRLLDLLTPVVEGYGFDLEDVWVRRAGRRRLVRVVVDGDGGVSLDDITAVSQQVSARLDEADPFGPTPYVLEVTSPGVDRPLREPRHWRRAAGRLVTVDVVNVGEVAGRVGHVDDDGVVLLLERGQQRYSYADLGPGRVQVEFAAQPNATPSGPDPVESGEEATWTST
jgi:ribosome maturation factor RimP